MVRTLSIILFFVMLGLPGCEDKVTIPEREEIYMSDLVGAWRGTLFFYHVDNGIQAASYNLENLRTSLILDTDRYWFELDYFTDSLDFILVNRGYWLLIEGSPWTLDFSVIEEWGSQMFKEPDTLGNPVVIDSIVYRKGDGTEIVNTWNVVLDYKENEIRLQDFIGSLVFEDLTLNRDQ